MTWVRFVLMLHFFMVAHKAACQTLVLNNDVNQTQTALCIGIQRSINTPPPPPAFKSVDMTKRSSNKISTQDVSGSLMVSLIKQDKGLGIRVLPPPPPPRKKHSSCLCLFAVVLPVVRYSGFFVTSIQRSGNKSPSPPKKKNKKK